jgi:hypothetical protein
MLHGEGEAFQDAVMIAIERTDTALYRREGLNLQVGGYLE